MPKIAYIARNFTPATQVVIREAVGYLADRRATWDGR